MPINKADGKRCLTQEEVLQRWKKYESALNHPGATPCPDLHAWAVDASMLEEVCSAIKKLWSRHAAGPNNIMPKFLRYAIEQHEEGVPSQKQCQWLIRTEASIMSAEAWEGVWSVMQLATLLKRMHCSLHSFLHWAPVTVQDHFHTLDAPRRNTLAAVVILLAFYTGRIGCSIVAKPWVGILSYSLILCILF